MGWSRFVALPFLLAIGAANPASDPTVAYELAPEMQGDAITALDVTIRLRADQSGTTTVDWINSWAGENKLGQWARDLSVDGGTSITPAPNGGRIIRSAPGAPLTMHYRIVSAYAADPTVKDSEQARPVVRPDFSIRSASLSTLVQWAATTHWLALSGVAPRKSASPPIRSIRRASATGRAPSVTFLKALPSEAAICRSTA